MDHFLQALVNGLLLGGFYGVMVLGFSVIWGVMGVINLAHGEFLMVGAYLAWGLFRFFGAGPFRFPGTDPATHVFGGLFAAASADKPSC